MSYLAWVVMGLLAGFSGSKILRKRGVANAFDVLLGIVGAVAGGFLYDVLGTGGVRGLNLYSLFVAVAGSILFLVIYHATLRRV